MAKILQFQFPLGYAPNPAGGAYSVPQEPLVGWRGNTLSDLSLLNAFSISISSALIAC